MRSSTRLAHLVLALFLFTGCFALAPETVLPVTMTEPDTVRVVILPFLSYAPFFIAEEEGMFAEQNIELDYIDLQQSAEAVPQLLLGNIDVHAGFLDAALINGMATGNMAMGEPPKLVADRGYLATDCTYFGLVQNANAPVTQLQGARISVRPDSFHGYYVEQFLQRAGLTWDDVEVVDIPNPASIDAIADKSVDLISIGEPWIQRIITQGGGEILVGAETILPDAAMSFTFYSAQFMEERPDVATRFMTAYLRAIRQYNEGKTDRNLEILAKHTNLEPELLKAACWPAIRNDGLVDAESIADYQAWLLSRGLIDAPIAFDQLWDGSFIAAALPNAEQK